MIGLDLGTGRSLLAIGAHADDIEIGCGATILRLVAEGVVGQVTWVVCSGTMQRQDEARASAAAFLAGVEAPRVVTADFRDGFFPWEGAQVKELFETLKRDVQPDLILTHRRGDAHQDHRQLGELTWNTWRDHMVLEYEIPKYEGDLGAPNLFVPLEAATAERKVELLLKCFPSQAHRSWFNADTFWSVLRLRGLECNAPSGLAEGFYVRKAVV
jgi:LmbE family N-acetylglucosaminyl deacetylase